MTEDFELLQRFFSARDECSFEQLVTRHVNLVFSAALRILQNDHAAAEDVAQQVFVDLARKAGSLPPTVVLAGWLYDAARFTAAKAVRTEQRRRLREQESIAMEHPSPSSEPAWQEIAPHLDEAMGELSAPDREAVLLRYFQNLDFQSVGRALGISDDTAQKRVSRAVERLREKLAKKGVTVGAAGLALLISTSAILTAPAGLIAASTAEALSAITNSAPAHAAGSTISWLNAKSAAMIVSAAILVGGGTFFVEERRQADSRQRAAESVAQAAELARARDEALALAETRLQQIDELRADVRELARLRGEVTRLRSEASRAAAPAGQANANGHAPVVVGLNVEHYVLVAGAKILPPSVPDAAVRTNITMKVGDNFSRVVIDRDVRALDATDLFADVRVSEQRTNGDLILTYSVEDKPAPVPPGRLITREQLAFAGYATPEAAEQTMMWALISANWSAVTNSLTPSAQKEFEDPQEQINFTSNIHSESSRFEGMQILARKDVADDKTELKISIRDRAKKDVQIQQMVRIGGEWKRGQSVAYAPEWDRAPGIKTYTPTQ